MSMMEDVLLLGGKKTKTDDDDEDDDDDGSDKDVVVVMGGGKGGDVDRGNGLDDTEDDEENDENDDQEGMDEEKEGGSEDRPSKRSGLKIPLDWWRYKSEKQAEEDEDDEMLGRALLQGDLIKMGSKVVAFLGLLAHAVNCSDKVLCFSQSLPTLEFLEMVLGSQGWGNALQLKSEEKGLLFSKWTSGHQFLKITGQTNGDERQRLIHQFNDKVCNESSLQLIHPIHILSTHPINAISTPYQYTLSTHPTNPPVYHTLVTRPLNPPSINKHIFTSVFRCGVAVSNYVCCPQKPPTWVSIYAPPIVSSSSIARGILPMICRRSIGSIAMDRHALHTPS